MTHKVHLVVLIHGLWGSPAHLLVAEEELEKAWAGSKTSQDISGPSEDPTITTRLTGVQSRSNGSSSRPTTKTKESVRQDGELVIMIAGGMTSQLTYDGVDVCASRVAYEVDQKIKELQKDGKTVNKFSVMGYSLGGLVARYLVGLLHSRQPSFFDKHRPISFSTISTPHYGIPKYNTLLSRVLSYLGARIMSRSGEQLYVADNYSDEDQRPLLEIMADPRSIFYQGLEKFERLEIYASAINDHSVPYPTATIEPVDHFAQWEQRHISVDSDADGIIQSWSVREDDRTEKPKNGNKKGWGIKMGTLPPVLRYRFPFNYIILLLFPIMLPLIVILILTRQSLDTRRSKHRLQLLSQTSTSSEGSYHIPHPSGMSIQALRDGIRRIERSLESDLVENVPLDSPSTSLFKSSSALFPHDHQNPNSSAHEDIDLKIELKDSQMRMCLWLNQLPLEKYLTWWPEIGNAHATAIVRDPKQFPAHERGRGLIKLWAKNTLNAAKA
ncbi:uncharacterized protein I303_101909 [Kwoniella dejecticola CBS 10117]|uniref:Lipid particle protein n=1 Tax=Kwoniella dejecticola CBS 10117 TaxID=1296121 RepID=A0A1A6ACH6_9TREE|nr:lipid particle protein [Kwoniella dejecticola CBS 10117]OBR87743.1 lipid particle protein [Kwoniella dejecticola CBS 10117]